MGNELIGKIYFSVDNEDWYSDTSEPVLNGFHLLDFVSTNRWSFISSNQKTCKTFLEQEKNAVNQRTWNLPLVKMADILIVTTEKHAVENDFNYGPEDILLPASFDPYNSYLIDVLLYLGIKLNSIEESEATILSKNWTENEKFDIIDVEREFRVVGKINEVIDFLVNNKIRVGAVTKKLITKYPERFNDKDFPNIDKLRFVCYSAFN